MDRYGLFISIIMLYYKVGVPIFMDLLVVSLIFYCSENNRYGLKIV